MRKLNNDCWKKERKQKNERRPIFSMVLMYQLPFVITQLSHRFFLLEAAAFSFTGHQMLSIGAVAY